MKEYGYWMQYALYCDGIEAATGVRPTEWYFVSAATKAPYEVAYPRFSLTAKARAVEAYRRALADYAQAVATGVWRSEWDEAIYEINLSQYDF